MNSTKPTDKQTKNSNSKSTSSSSNMPIENQQRIELLKFESQKFFNKLQYEYGIDEEKRKFYQENMRLADEELAQLEKEVASE